MLLEINIEINTIETYQLKGQKYFTLHYSTSTYQKSIGKQLRILTDIFFAIINSYRLQRSL